MRVILHIGAPKTGTSAVQSALAVHRSALAAAGIFYPTFGGHSDREAERGGFSTGNAGRIGQYLAGREHVVSVARSEIMAMLSECVAQADGRDILLSSEVMAAAQRTRIDEMLEWFAARGYEPLIVYYVRHLLDHAVSAFLQHLKTGFRQHHGDNDVASLGGFLRRHHVGFLPTLQAYSYSARREGFVVRVYDEERAALLGNFFGALGLSLPKDSVGSVGDVNRSLTPEEAGFFVSLMKLPDGPRICEVMMQVVLSTPRPSKTQFFVSEEDYSVFADNNRPGIAEINRIVFLGEERLKMRSDRIGIGAPPVSSAETLNDILAPSVAEVVRRFDKVRSRLAHRRREGGAASS